MKEYKKLDLKNDHGADNLVHHLNEGWDIFREFPGWLIVFKDKEDIASPAEPEKPVYPLNPNWRNEIYELMGADPSYPNSTAKDIISIIEKGGGAANGGKSDQ